jgi:putative aldouronate transport system substrate-binding protein
MLKKSLKIMSIIMTLGIVMSIFSGCKKSGGANSGIESTEKDPYANVPKEISVLMFDRGVVASSEGTYEENRWTKYINEKSGIKVKWIPVPRTQNQQKTNALIASGQAPDLIWEYSRDYMAQLVDQGAIQPIDDHLKKYSKTYNAYLNKNQELKPYVTFGDKMYAWTSKRSVESIANHAMWIRKDWLDKLGLKVPTTDEELFQVAKAFKDLDPDANGKADTYGFAFNYNMSGIVQALYGAANSLVENGKIVDPIDTQRYKDVLTFRKRMFDEGLIDKEFITDKNYTRERQIWVTGKAGIYFGSWNMENEWKDLKKNVPTAEMVALEPVSTKYGRFGLWQEPPANIIVGLNKDSKNPKAAVEFMDWLIQDENWFPIKFGIEGTNYKMVNGVPQSIDAEKNRTELGYSGEYALINAWDVKPEWFPIIAAQDSLSQEYAKIKTNSLQVAMKNKFPRATPFNATSPEISQFNTDIAPIREDIETKVITGGSKYTVEWGFEQMQNERKRLGYSNIEKIIQEWYDKNKANFSK